jgi:hypothetical protein
MEAQCTSTLIRVLAVSCRKQHITKQRALAVCHGAILMPVALIAHRTRAICICKRD